MEQKIRLLRADEIECRVATVNEKGLACSYIKMRVPTRIF